MAIDTYYYGGFIEVPFENDIYTKLVMYVWFW